MRPDQVRSLILRAELGTFFSDACYDLELRARCQQYGTRSDPLPRAGGVYALRAKGDPLWAYVGQTNNFVARIQHLQGIFKAGEMPFSDPHKAAPALWAWMKNQPEIELEVVVSELSEASTSWRQGLEHFIIACHRWQFGCSPRWQFGRIPRGWSPSTPRRGGVRGRNIPEDVALGCHRPGIVPITKLFEDQSGLFSDYWAGHRWSPWYSSVKDLPLCKPEQRGLYRLKRGNNLVFLGIYGVRKDELEKEEQGEEEETEILSLARAKKRAGALSLERIFQESERQGVQGSFVSGTWLSHELRELWTDMVALYLRQQLALPQAQFGGTEERPQLPNLQETMRYLCTWLAPGANGWPFPLAS